ncbi:hypothetical protein PR048_020637 [Dryococelus australis]|uniref:Uncharacterized protein n=1 Tax=Dryococelus australis TaxID=614101 RepID=A0ABQ9H701_9NEOP|nr:hypothetical protein PR048_020637 [Dryococelus australis]
MSEPCSSVGARYLPAGNPANRRNFIARLHSPVYARASLAAAPESSQSVLLHTWQYDTRYLFPCKSDIGSESSRAPDRRRRGTLLVVIPRAASVPRGNRDRVYRGRDFRGAGSSDERSRPAYGAARESKPTTMPVLAPAHVTAESANSFSTCLSSRDYTPPIQGMSSQLWGVSSKESALSSQLRVVSSKESALRSQFAVSSEESASRSQHRGSALSSQHRGDSSEESTPMCQHRGVSSEESALRNDTLKNRTKIYKDSSFESKHVISPIPSAESMGMYSADDYDETVNANDGMRDLRGVAESVCVECTTFARRLREVDELHNKRSSALNTDDDHTIMKTALMIMTMKTVLMKYLIRRMNDSLDVPTYFISEFPSTGGVKKAEGVNNARYIFPEDPSEFVDIFTYLIDLRKCGDFSRNVETFSIIDELKDQGRRGRPRQKCTAFTAQLATASADEWFPPARREDTAVAMESTPPPRREDTAVPMESSLPPRQKDTAVAMESYLPPRQKDTAVAMESTPPPRREDTAVPMESSLPPRQKDTAVAMESYLPPRQKDTAVPIESPLPPRQKDTAVAMESTPPPRREDTAVPMESSLPPRQDTAVAMESTPPPRREDTAVPIERPLPPRQEDTAVAMESSLPPRSEPPRPKNKLFRTRTSGMVLVSIQVDADSSIGRLVGQTSRFQPRGTGVDSCAVNLGFSHVEIVPDDGVGRRFSGGYPVSPAPCILALLHTHLTSTHIDSQDLDYKSRQNCSTTLLSDILQPVESSFPWSKTC